jgi:hypothetical protein
VILDHRSSSIICSLLSISFYRANTHEIIRREKIIPSDCMTVSDLHRLHSRIRQSFPSLTNLYSGNSSEMYVWTGLIIRAHFKRHTKCPRCVSGCRSLIYTADVGQLLGRLPPHIFAIADTAYRFMREEGKNQSVIIRSASPFFDMVGGGDGDRVPTSAVVRVVLVKRKQRS